MTKQNTIINQDEKIKMWWLAFLCTITFLKIFSSFAEENFGMNLSSDTSIRMLIPAIFYALSGYILYHCAYKKYGTKLLTFNLFAQPLMVVIRGFHDGIDIFSLIDVLIAIVWWLLCFNLRKINMKMRTKEVPTFA